jgi:hypothetical protein
VGIDAEQRSLEGAAESISEEAAKGRRAKGPVAPKARGFLSGRTGLSQFLFKSGTNPL